MNSIYKTTTNFYSVNKGLQHSIPLLHSKKWTDDLHPTIQSYQVTFLPVPHYQDSVPGVSRTLTAPVSSREASRTNPPGFSGTQQATVRDSDYNINDAKCPTICLCSNYKAFRTNSLVTEYNVRYKSYPYVTRSNRITYQQPVCRTI